MLAATSRRDSPIGLFMAVLKSLGAHPEIGAPLREHAMQVLRSACDIAADPSSINATTPPESIELALQLRGDEILKQKLQELRSLESIPPAVAQQLLTAFAPIAA
jgi:hypothetical protein